MKRKMILVGALAIMLLTIIPSVMAAPGGNKVAASCTTTWMRYPVPPEDQWVNPGGITKSGIMHVGEFETYYAVLDIGGALHFIYSWNVVDMVLNSKTGLAVSQSDAIWYASEYIAPVYGEDLTLEVPTDDGFAGKVTLSIYDLFSSSPSLKAHVLMHGFGDFAGQTLDLWYSGPFVLTSPFVGFCIKG